MRDRFDKTREEKDMRKLAAMVEEGEEEAWRNQHFDPFIFKVLLLNLSNISDLRIFSVIIPKNLKDKA